MSYGVDVMAFGPHPDDVEIFCGGTLLRLRELGYTTGVVDLSRGELASHGTPEERAVETHAATAVLDLSFRDNLELPDGFIGHGVRELELNKVVTVLRKRRPELVLIPWLEERHPDHVAASKLLTDAVFYAGLKNFLPGLERHAPRQVLYYAMRYQMTPSFLIDTSSVIDKKRAAIACYRSQVTRKKGEPETLISSPLAIDAVVARDQYYGSMIGTRAAEPLRAANQLGLVDPVAHFRQNPFTSAHAFLS